MFNYNMLKSEEKLLGTTEDSESLLSSTSALPASTTSQCPHDHQRILLRACHAVFFYLIVPVITLLIGISVGRIMSTDSRSVIEQVSKYCESI